MNEISLGVLITVSSLLIIRGIVSKTGSLRYPFLAALVVAGWFIPQAFGLVDDLMLPDGGFALTMFYVSACLVAVHLGDERAKRPLSINIVAYDEKRLLIGAGVLSTVGLFAYSQIFRVSIEVNEQGQSTGLVTILFFFAKLQFFGFGIALLLLMNRWSWPALAIVLIDLNSIMGFVIFGARRGPAVDIVLISLCLLWFQRRNLVPPVVLVTGAAVAAIVVNSVGHYRSLVATNGRLPTLEELFTIDFLGNFTRIINEGFYEVRNAINYITAAFETNNYDLGLSYWNFLIFSYIPGQIVGADVKAALMFNLSDNAIAAYGYQRHIGTTFTGFADSFNAFSFLGVLVFFAISRLLANWWHRGNAGDVRAQALYAISMATALHGVTHGTLWFVVFLPMLIIFLLPLFAWARTKRVQSRIRETQLPHALRPAPMRPRFIP